MHMTAENKWKRCGRDGAVCKRTKFLLESQEQVEKSVLKPKTQTKKRAIQQFYTSLMWIQILRVGTNALKFSIFKTMLINEIAFFRS
mmetsp:Transcript_5489/g.11137  ORF Transcript_5489/g.11137 Transcript_5489/m.11137 type:complete len:87 (-) Transcript_5489:146-406(-)